MTQDTPHITQGNKHGTTCSCKNCQALIQDTPRWEKSFNEAFIGDQELLPQEAGAEVKSFISHLLSQRTEEIKKMVEGMRNETEMREIDGVKYSDGYHQALSDLLQAIEKLQ